MSNALNSTGKIVLKENNKNPGQYLTANDFLNVFSDVNVPSIRIGSHNNLTLGSAYGGYLARGNATTLYPLVNNDRMMTFAGNGWNGASYSSSATLEFYVVGNWNSTHSPSRITFRTTPNGSTTRQDAVDVNERGDIAALVVGAGFKVKEGTNAKQGTCTMVAGNCIVANTAITANSRLFYNYQAPCSTNIGNLYEISRNASVNFTIRNTNAANTCVIAYEIFEPS